MEILKSSVWQTKCGYYTCKMLVHVKSITIIIICLIIKKLLIANSFVSIQYRSTYQNIKGTVNNVNSKPYMYIIKNDMFTRQLDSLDILDRINDMFLIPWLLNWQHICGQRCIFWCFRQLELEIHRNLCHQHTNTGSHSE